MRHIQPQEIAEIHRENTTLVRKFKNIFLWSRGFGPQRNFSDWIIQILNSAQPV